MNIQPINYNFTRKKRLSREYDPAPSNRLKDNNAEVCGQKNDKNEYNVNFSGGLHNRSEAAAKSFMEKIMDNRAFDWLTGFSGKHNVAASSLIGLFLAGGLRPAITISLPGKKDKEDKIYAAGHSMASGLIGFGFSTLITTPLDSGINYIFKDAKKMRQQDYDKLSKEEIAEYMRKNNGEPIQIRKLKKGLTIVSDKVDEINALKHQLSSVTDFVERGKIYDKIRNLEKVVKGIETSMHNVTEWVIAIPRAALTIALIPPILKYVFHLEKQSKKTVMKQPQQNQTPQNQEDNLQADRFFVTTSMNDFMGGVK